MSNSENESDENEEESRMDSAFDGVGEVMREQEAESSPQDTTETEETELEGDIDITTTQPTSTESHGKQTNEQEKAQTITTDDEIKRDDIPHRVRCDSPKDEREPLNIYIGSEDRQRFNHLKNLAEQEFDEKVNTIDVYLAALRSDFNDDDSFIKEMREMGYGFFD